MPILEQTNYYYNQIMALNLRAQGPTYYEAFEDDLEPIRGHLETSCSLTTRLIAGCIAFIETDAASRIFAVPFLSINEKRGGTSYLFYDDANSSAVKFAADNDMRIVKNGKYPFMVGTYSWRNELGQLATYAKSYENYPEARDRDAMLALRELSCNIPEVEICIPVSPVKWLHMKNSRSTRLRLSYEE